MQYIVDQVVDLFYQSLTQVVLRVPVDWLVLAKNAIENAWRLFRIHFSLLPEVNTTNPLVLDLLEGRLDLQQHRYFIEQVPENLILAVDVVVFGGFADVGEFLYLSMGFFNFQVLFAFLVCFVLFFEGFRVRLLWWH